MNPIILKRSVHHIPVLEVVLKELREERIPVVIYYHGWQTSKELVLTQGRKIAQQGIRVILPDAMNHGERKQPVSSIPSYTFWDSIYGNLFEFDTLIKHLEKGLYMISLQLAGFRWGMTTCALLAKHPHIVAGVCLMGSPAPLEYGKEIVRRASEYNYVVPKDYFDLISWVKSYDLSLQPEKLAGRPLFFGMDKLTKNPLYTNGTICRKNRHKSYGKKLFSFLKTQRHMVQIPLMEEASTF